MEIRDVLAMMWRCFNALIRLINSIQYPLVLLISTLLEVAQEV